MEEKQQMSFATVVDDTNSRMKQIEAFKNKPISGTAQKVAFTGLVVGGLMLASLMIFHIITGILALVAMAAAGIGLWAGWHWVKAMSPSFKQKMKNESIKRMIAEARKNAVSQLDNRVLDRRAHLLKSREARNDMGGLVEAMRTKLASADRTSESYKKMHGILERTEAAYKTVCENIDKAAESNKKFESKVQEYKDLDDFANMAGDAMAVFDQTTDGKLQEMLSLESFKAIDSEFNSAIISIENSSRDMAIDNK